MNLKPEIKTLQNTLLVGIRMRMSFAKNRTAELWQKFMPHKKAVKHVSGDELYSVEVFDNFDFFKKFDPDQEFEKWAAVKVSKFDFIPEEMEVLNIPEGLYAVFQYKGTADKAAETYRYIFNTWLPDSCHSLDARPHLAIMGEKYRNNDPDSEEEIWIPVK